MSDIEKKSTSNEAIGHHEVGDGTLAALPPDPDAHLSPEDRAARVRCSSTCRYPLPVEVLTYRLVRTASSSGVLILS